jgi:hypothetical protein
VMPHFSDSIAVLRKLPAESGQAKDLTRPRTDLTDAFLVTLRYCFLSSAWSHPSGRNTSV